MPAYVLNPSGPTLRAHADVGYKKFPDTIEGSLLGIQSTAIGSIGAVLNFAVAFFVAGRTAETPEKVQQMIDSVRVPRGVSAAQSH